MKVKNRFNSHVLCEYQSKRDFCLDRKRKVEASTYDNVCKFVLSCPLTITGIKEESFK